MAVGVRLWVFAAVVCLVALATPSVVTATEDDFTMCMICQSVVQQFTGKPLCRSYSPLRQRKCKVVKDLILEVHSAITATLRFLPDPKQVCSRLQLPNGSLDICEFLIANMPRWSGACEPSLDHSAERMAACYRMEHRLKRGGHELVETVTRAKAEGQAPADICNARKVKDVAEMKAAFVCEDSAAAPDYGQDISESPAGRPGRLSPVKELEAKLEVIRRAQRTINGAITNQANAKSMIRNELLGARGLLKQISANLATEADTAMIDEADRRVEIVTPTVEMLQEIISAVRDKTVWSVFGAVESSNTWMRSLSQWVPHLAEVITMIDGKTPQDLQYTAAGGIGDPAVHAAVVRTWDYEDSLSSAGLVSDYASEVETLLGFLREELPETMINSINKYFSTIEPTLDVFGARSMDLNGLPTPFNTGDGGGPAGGDIPPPGKERREDDEAPPGAAAAKGPVRADNVPKVVLARMGELDTALLAILARIDGHVASTAAAGKKWLGLSPTDHADLKALIPEYQSLLEKTDGLYVPYHQSMNRCLRAQAALKQLSTLADVTVEVPEDGGTYGAVVSEASTRMLREMMLAMSGLAEAPATGRHEGLDTKVFACRTVVLTEQALRYMHKRYDAVTRMLAALVKELPPKENGWQYFNEDLSVLWESGTRELAAVAVAVVPKSLKAQLMLLNGVLWRSEVTQTKRVVHQTRERFYQAARAFARAVEAFCSERIAGVNTAIQEARHAAVQAGGAIRALGGVDPL